MASLGAFIKLFSQPTSPAEFVDRPPSYLDEINLRALAEAERRKQDEAGPSFRTVDPMAEYEESQRVGAFNALQNIPNSPLGGAVALIPGAYEGLTKPVEGANPEAPNMLAAVDQMSLGGLIEGNVLGGVMRTKPAEPVGPPARLRGQPTLGGLATADPFYSQVRTVLEDPKTQGTQTGEAWSRFLSDPKRGVKAEEMQYTGLRDLLKAKAGERVTKEEITSHLDANEIEVKEVTKGLKFSQSMLNDEAMKEYDKPYDELDASQKSWIDNVFGDAGLEGGAPKFSQYTLPGAENYREVLLTTSSKAKLTAKPMGEGRWQVLDEGGVGIGSGMGATAEEAIADYGGVGQTLKGRFGFTGGHWGEPDVLAHLRLSDRTVGGKRTLLVEEIQSDWAQKGRKEGFADKLPADREVRQTPDGAWAVYNGDTLVRGTLSATRELAERKYIEKQSGVPSGPFVTDTSKWTALGLKRVLKMAADEGYDSIGIVPGVEQAKRYDLSKQVQAVFAEKKDDGTYSLNAYVSETGRTEQLGASIPPEKLADHVGKDLAEKIVSQGGGKFTGVDLQVGGEGMKGYYDKIVPDTLNKLAKEYGVKVQIEGGRVAADHYKGYVDYEIGSSQIGNPSIFGVKSDGEKVLVKQFRQDEGLRAKEELKQLLQDRDVGVPVHTLEVPEHMKKAIKSKGFPLYSSLQGKTLGDLANA